jgi:hypothetical protein
MKYLLHRLDFPYINTAEAEACAGQPAPAQQSAFLDEYEKLKKTKGENDPICFFSYYAIMILFVVFCL